MAEREQEPDQNGSEGGSSDSDEPQVPEGVLRGIEDIEEGNTASKDDIDEALKF